MSDVRIRPCVIILDVSFYGIATAFTGKTSAASFHCNTIKLDSDKTPAPSEQVLADIEKYPWEQRRLTSEAHFEPVDEQSFTEDNINLDSPEEVRAVAKNFIDTVADTIKLQQQDPDHGSSPVHIIVGQDGRYGHDIYTKKSPRKIFLAAAQAGRIRELIQDCRFYPGSFHLQPQTMPKTKTTVASNNNELTGLKHKLGTKDGHENALRKLQAIALKHGFYFALECGVPLRFIDIFKDPLRTFEYLGWDKEIERAFTAGVYLYIHEKRKLCPPTNKEIEAPHHCFVKIDSNTKSEPFVDVLKTLLMDLLAKSEDGQNRIDYSYDTKLKRKIERDLRKLNSSPSQ